MKKYIKKLISIPSILAISISLLTACSVPQSEPTPSPSEKSANETVYAFVGKDIQNPYSQKVFEGFESACNEIGIEAIYKAPTSATADKQIEIINELMDNNVDGIAISANDADALEPALTEALNSGIEVISVDAPVNSISRKTHIQQADPEVLGRNFMKSAYDVSNGEGGFAILTSTGSAPNQNQWIRYLKLEMDENPEKYSNMPLIEIAYGDDDATKSYTETQYLLQNDAIKTIIVPTTIGLSSAAKALKESGKVVIIDRVFTEHTFYQLIVMLVGKQPFILHVIPYFLIQTAVHFSKYGCSLITIAIFGERERFTFFQLRTFYQVNNLE